MRRPILILAGLYPRSWRERYGREFGALLEDVDPSVGMAVNVFTGALGMQMRNAGLGKMLAASAAFGAVVVAGMFFAIPKLYSSEAVLRVEGQSGPRMTQGAIDLINGIVQSVESRAVLTDIVRKDDLYPNARMRMPLEDVMDRMRKDVKVRPGAGGLFSVGFAYPNPELAQKVTQDLSARFVEENFRRGPSSGEHIALSVLDPAKLPEHPLRSDGALIASGTGGGVLMFGALLLWRRMAARRSGASAKET